MVTTGVSVNCTHTYAGVVSLDTLTRVLASLRKMNILLDRYLIEARTFPSTILWSLILSFVNAQKAYIKVGFPQPSCVSQVFFLPGTF